MNPKTHVSVRMTLATLCALATTQCQALSEPQRTYALLLVTALGGFAQFGGPWTVSGVFARSLTALAGALGLLLIYQVGPADLHPVLEAALAAIVSYAHIKDLPEIEEAGSTSSGKAS